MTTATAAPLYKLDTQKGREGLQQEFKSRTHHQLWKELGLDDYLETGVVRVTYQGHVIALDTNNELVCVQRGLIFNLNTYDLDSLIYKDTPELSSIMKSALDQADVVGVVLPNPLPKSKCVKGFIFQGDEDYNLLVNGSYLTAPTLSFTCLARFFFPDPRTKQIESIAKRLAAGTLQVVDYTPDSSIPLTKTEKKAFQKLKDNGPVRKNSKPVQAPKPPERGYVKVDNVWHRSSTVLLYASPEDKTILMGVDESTYFGCLLRDHPKSIADAYTSLIPESIRSLPNITRQGEWFFVPVNLKDVPKVEDCVALFDRLCLPVDNPDAHGHWIRAHEEEIDPQDDANLPDSGRIGRDGTIYACDPSLHHPDHETVITSGWYKFVRNTAVQSYSEAGVD